MDQELCRTCLRAPQKLLSLQNDYILLGKIKTISSVQISPEDGLPKTICEECVQNINRFFNFRKIIINSDKDLKERFAVLQNTKNYSDTPAIIKEEEQTNEITNLVVCDTIKSESVETIIEETDIPRKNLETTSLNEATETNSTVPATLRAKLANKKTLLDCRMHIRSPRILYSCNRCDFSCKEHSKYQNHRRTHHSAPGICNICGKSMRTDNLGKHVRSHSAPPVACEVCGKMFKNSESLRSHSFLHRGIEHDCTICGKRYSYKGELTRHIRIQHEGQVPPKKQICSLCGKAFAHKKNLDQHMLSHTGERPYPCEYCKKGFSSTYALKTHIRQHTNERPYICEYCPMAFPQKVSLMTHLKSKHTRD